MSEAGIAIASRPTLTAVWIVYRLEKGFWTYVAYRYVLIGSVLFPTSQCRGASSLEQLHAKLPPDLTRFGRFEAQPENVVENWL